VSVRPFARLAVAVVGSIVALTACSSDGKKPATTTTTEMLSTSTTTTAPSSSTRCVAGTVPATSVRRTQVKGDVDGDGRVDTVAVYGTGTANAPGPWFVSVDLTTTGLLVTPIADADPDDPNQNIRVLGVAPAGGAPAVFVAVGTGASATIVGLFQLVRGCDLVRVTTEAGAPATFTVGGTVTHLDGLRCPDGGGLDVLSARSTDGDTYAGTVTPAVVADGHVTLAPPMTVDPIAAPDLSAFGALACPGVEPL
jgi:hypothetical protein